MLTRRRLLAAFRPVVALLAAMWVVEGLNWAAGGFDGDHPLNGLMGLRPRSLDGLIGVPAAPFLHACPAHLISNTLSLMVLGTLALFAAPGRFIDATVIIILLGGALVWVLARPGNYIHVGASGLIFGYFGFLAALAVLERNLRAIAAALTATAICGGMLYGMAPMAEKTSWEMHLFGFVAGCVAALGLRRRRAA